MVEGSPYYPRMRLLRWHDVLLTFLEHIYKCFLTLTLCNLQLLGSCLVK